MSELIVYVVGGILLAMVGIRIVVGVTKFLYEIAPTAIFLGACIALMYFSGNLNEEVAEISEIQNANNTGSTEIKSESGKDRNKRNNTKALHKPTARRQGIKD